MEFKLFIIIIIGSGFAVNIIAKRIANVLNKFETKEYSKEYKEGDILHYPVFTPENRQKFKKTCK